MICSYSWASVGTTEDTIAACTSASLRSRRSSRPARTVATSSAVAKRVVAKRQCWTRSSSENMPTWVWVLPTSIASSTRASLRPQGRTDGMEAAVHVQDLAGDRPREVREQEEHRVGHRRGVAGVPVQRRLLAPEAGESVEAGDAL